MQQINPAHVDTAEAAFSNGQALLISGPQGCGKSILARMLANQRGAFLEPSVHDIINKLKFAGLLLRRPKTLIVDECELLGKWLKNAESRATFKQMLSSVEQCVPEKGQLVRIVPPKFIFCTNLDNPPEAMTGRQFCWIRMGAQP